MTETKDWTQRLHDYGAKAKENAKKVVERLLTKKDSEKAKQAAFLDDLKACAEESTALMGDPRYPRQQKFLTELRTMYSKNLELLASKGLLNEVSIARLGAMISTLDTLINRPKQVVKEYESMQKELNK